MGRNGTDFAKRLLEVTVSIWIQRLSGAVKDSGTASKLITAQLPEAHMVQRNWKMWRINRLAWRGGLKHTTPDEPLGPAVPQGLWVHTQLLPVW